MLFLWLIVFFEVLSNKIIAQKGTWQLRLEKERSQTSDIEKQLLLDCQIAQEMKEYDLPTANKQLHSILEIAQNKKIRIVEAYAHYGIAECLRMSGKTYVSINHYHEALKILRSIGSNWEIAQVKRDSVLSFANLSKFGTIQKGLEIATSFFEKKAPQQRQHGITLFHLAANLLRLSQYEKALHTAQEAKKIFQKIGDNIYTARCLNAIGLIYRNMGYQALALEHYLKAVKIYQQIGENQKSASMVYANIGNLYVNLKDKFYQQEATKYYQKAYQIALSIKDTLQIVATLEFLAKAAATYNNFEQAKSYYLQGLEIIHKTDNWIEAGFYTLRASEIYILFKQPEQAIKLAQEVVDKFSKREVPEALAQAQAILARHYTHVGNYQLSQTLAYKALQNTIEDDHHAISPIYTLMIGNAIKLKRYIEAEYWAEYALKHYKKVHGTGFLLTVYKYLIQLDTIQKEYQRAVQWFTAFNTLRDSVLKEDHNRNLLEMQFQYNLQEQKKENEYLKNLNKAQVKANQLQSIVLTLVGLGLGFVSIAYYFLFRHRQKLQRLLATVQLQNQQINEKNEEIEAQKQILEKLNLTKDRIISIISHDMRNPLANLKILLEMVSKGFIDAQEQIAITQRISQDINHIYNFLEDLLLWADSQSQGFSPNIVLIDLHAIAQEVIQITQNQAKNKNIHLQNLIPENLIIQTDKDIIKTVLLNLVTNAIKFTNLGGYVKINYQTAGSNHILIVEDNGVGIALENRDKIFGQERFTTKGTLQEKGTGFGLAICKDFILSLGGNIYFESTIGKGTTFYVELPQ
ncbi:MAG: tetratricopeptide repeat-containing sensor histidine kinase [Microscillaceae bacterium]|nr:tetratricopeptide repeat-containing sensor histidine kinase [Microscillaceae bacterium]MDW8460484.1 tetratricopeptide repeat-containing sensor histidine kinase [Cytophagales bacterium]